jgi:glycine N-methyltransferase
MVDSIYRMRSLGVAAEGIPDQYADGKAARVWEAYIGGKQNRTDQYRNWIVDLLRRHSVRRVLDVACGTGVDSMMLVEEGFEVVSTDASDKMLKYALKERWQRRRQPAFNRWVIEEANWLTLAEDVKRFTAADPDAACGDQDGEQTGPQLFDAVICIGNSFAHLPDFSGAQTNQRHAVGNFRSMLKPGGILVIDHRNYDEILSSGQVPAKNVYYNSSHILGIKCSTLCVDGRPTMVTMDYNMDLAGMLRDQGEETAGQAGEGEHRFRLSYYPHRLVQFTALLKDVFGSEAPHQVFGDFKALGEIDIPAYYIHIIQRID